MKSWETRVKVIFLEESHTKKLDQGADTAKERILLFVEHSRQCSDNYKKWTTIRLKYKNSPAEKTFEKYQCHSGPLFLQFENHSLSNTVTNFGSMKSLELIKNNIWTFAEQMTTFYSVKSEIYILQMVYNLIDTATLSKSTTSLYNLS